MKLWAKIYVALSIQLSNSSSTTEVTLTVTGVVDNKNPATRISAKLCVWTRFNAIKVLLHQACLFSQLCLNLFLFCLVSWCELKTVRIGAPHGGLNKLNNGINWPFHHDLWGHFHHRKRCSSHTVCSSSFIFGLGSSIKDVGNLEGGGRGQNSLKFGDGKK